MNLNLSRSWNVLSWNVRGVNASWKWNAIRDKVVEAACAIVCFQETKRDHFDLQFLRHICPADFDSFECLPSVGASGGILVAWKSALFAGELLFSNEFALSVEFTSLHNNANWILTCVYGPCTADRKQTFVDWMKDIHMPDGVDWIILGDFNLMRKPENRNRPEGNISEMLMFNDAISTLGLNEIALQGRKYTWSNQQQPSPLLEKLDWVFTNDSWTISFPSTSVKALGMDPSDHCPCAITISTPIPRKNFFRFENYWMDHSQFLPLIQQGWSSPTNQQEEAKIITAKLKKLRHIPREWQASMTNLRTLIKNVKMII